jgi:hypothetical protein
MFAVKSADAVSRLRLSPNANKKQSDAHGRRQRAASDTREPFAGCGLLVAKRAAGIAAPNSASPTGHQRRWNADEPLFDVACGPAMPRVPSKQCSAQGGPSGAGTLRCSGWRDRGQQVRTAPATDRACCHQRQALFIERGQAGSRKAGRLDRSLNQCGRHLWHLAGHARTIPVRLDEYGRCAYCVRRGWWKPDA